MKTPLKQYTVNVQYRCKDCGKLHYALSGGFSYKAETPWAAACKMHEYIRGGGSYGDMWPLSRDRTVVFRVKERGTPKNEGVTYIEQTKFLNA